MRAIPGQRSGISLTYFFMLAGSDDLVKPDRMLGRFLRGCLSHEVGPKRPRSCSPQPPPSCGSATPS